MNTKLVSTLLNSDKSVREILEEYEPRSPIGAFMDDDDNSTESEVQAQAAIQENETLLHTFVRRFRKGETEPYKKAKVKDCAEAINLYFEWAGQYKQDGVEIFATNAQDAKNFYRFCVQNREQIEQLYKNSIRMKKTRIPWTAAFKQIQTNARQSGSNLVGTLAPFTVDITGSTEGN